MKLGFVIDNTKCIGCHACTVACKAEHDVPIGVNRTWVKYIEKGKFPDSRRLFSVMRCNHCDDAPCAEICPTSALYTRSDGIVDFNNERCIGCKACMQACPYDSLYIDPNSQTAAKCNYCSQRTEVGLEPACVNVCPTEAIISGDMENPNSKIAKILSREQVSSRKIEKGTKPKLFYLEGDQSSLVPTESAPSEQYLWSEQSKGVGHFAGKSSGDNKKEFPATHEVIAEQGEQVHVPRTRDPFTMLKKAKGVLKENIRRVYDSPNKGVQWGWEITGYIIAKAIASGVVSLAFLVSLTGRLTAGELFTSTLATLFFLAVTGLFLILDLDQPKRFLYVIFRPHFKSWLVKGAYIISAFGAMLGLWVFSYFLLPQPVTSVISLLLLPLAALTTIYTAFLLGQAKARDFWQNPLLAFHMGIHALIGGAAVLMLLSLAGFISFFTIAFWNFFLIAGILGHLLLIALERLMPHPTVDAKKASDIIFKKDYKNHFNVGVLLLGSLLPLGLLFLSSGVLGFALASFLAIGGICLSTHLWVKAPQLIPLS